MTTAGFAPDQQLDLQKTLTLQQALQSEEFFRGGYPFPWNPPGPEFWQAVLEARKAKQPLEKKHKGPRDRKAPRDKWVEEEQIDKRTGEVKKVLVPPPAFMFVSADDYLEELDRVCLPKDMVVVPSAVVDTAPTGGRSLAASYWVAHAKTGQGMVFRADTAIGSQGGMGDPTKKAYTDSLAMFSRGFLGIPRTNMIEEEPSDPWAPPPGPPPQHQQQPRPQYQQQQRPPQQQPPPQYQRPQSPPQQQQQQSPPQYMGHPFPQSGPPPQGAPQGAPFHSGPGGGHSGYPPPGPQGPPPGGHPGGAGPGGRVGPMVPPHQQQAFRQGPVNGQQQSMYQSSPQGGRPPVYQEATVQQAQAILGTPPPAFHQNPYQQAPPMHAPPQPAPEPAPQIPGNVEGLDQPPPPPEAARVRGARDDEPQTMEAWRDALIEKGWDEDTALQLASHKGDEPIPDALREEIVNKALTYYGSADKVRDAFQGTGFEPQPGLPAHLRPKPTGLQLLRYAVRMDYTQAAQTGH